jgi:hypothetical protein
MGVGAVAEFLHRMNVVQGRWGEGSGRRLTMAGAAAHSGNAQSDQLGCGWQQKVEAQGACAHDSRVAVSIGELPCAHPASSQ